MDLDQVENKEPAVTIYVAEYNYLLDQRRILEALYAAGVDNWEGYDFALSELDDD